MARPKRDSAKRNSRNWGQVSGVTISTLESGTTIDKRGIDFGGSLGVPIKVSGGRLNYGGTSVSVVYADEGITALQSIVAGHSEGTGGASAAQALVRISFPGSGVSMDVAMYDPTDSSKTTTPWTSVPSSATINWMAFHT